jgi:hypothetical protein
MDNNFLNYLLPKDTSSFVMTLVVERRMRRLSKVLKS